MKLKKLKNTAVHCPTQKVYDTLMKIYEDAGWAWNTGKKPTEDSIWKTHKEKTCVECKDYFQYSYKKYLKKECYKVITFAQFKKLQGLTKKKQEKHIFTEHTPPLSYEGIIGEPATGTLIHLSTNQKIYIEILEWLYTNDVCIQREAFIKKLRELLEVK